MTAPLFTPTTARDLHRNLIEWWGSEPAQRYQRSFVSDKPGFLGLDPHALQGQLRAAETFLVTDEMSAVVRHAALTLPTFSVEHDIMPAELGFMVLNDRPGDHGDALGDTPPAQAIAWRAAVDDDGRAGFAATLYFSREDIADFARAREPDDRLAIFVETDAVMRWPLIPAVFAFLPWGVDPPMPSLYVPDAATEFALRMLVAAWLLMSQPIAQREHPQIYRPAAKRAARAGLLSDLTVVMLRQPKTAPSDEPAGREYHRRWIVRGHWRRIPLPEQPSRVTWVHGYVKGPADAPLVMTDRVTVLAR